MFTVGLPDGVASDTGEMRKVSLEMLPPGLEESESYQECALGCSASVADVAGELIPDVAPPTSCVEGV
jgi:hypothetical protein